MLNIKSQELLDLIHKEFESISKCSYVDSSTIYLGEVDGIEFTITLSRDEESFMEEGDHMDNAIITKSQGDQS